ncbi:MAG: hypothetical protein M0C28_27595 [Candidatus Moduliflexus flocculans]|nr:hypothetical protein [Candidatus Moduliflexus flocculans]
MSRGWATYGEGPDSRRREDGAVQSYRRSTRSANHRAHAGLRRATLADQAQQGANESAAALGGHAPFSSYLGDQAASISSARGSIPEMVVEAGGARPRFKRRFGATLERG